MPQTIYVTDNEHIWKTYIRKICSKLNVNKHRIHKTWLSQFAKGCTEYSFWRNCGEILTCYFKFIMCSRKPKKHFNAPYPVWTKHNRQLMCTPKTGRANPTLQCLRVITVWCYPWRSDGQTVPCYLIEIKEVLFWKQKCTIRHYSERGCHIDYNLSWKNFIA